MTRSVVRTLGGTVSLLLLIGLSGCSDADDDPVGPDPSTCRIYPTAFTDVSVDNVSTVRVTSSGTYDTATNRTTYNVHYSDSAGPDFSYVLVTTYRSTDEFIDEVKVKPPRTMSIESVASGSNGFRVANSYDAQRRLNQTTTTAAGETVTTTYTSWDNAGRPLTGARSSTGTLSIQYNDTTRTQTTVLVGRGTEVATFDVNGNPSTVVRDFGPGQVTTTTTITSTATICK